MIAGEQSALVARQFQRTIPTPAEHHNTQAPGTKTPEQNRCWSSEGDVRDSKCHKCHVVPIARQLQLRLHPLNLGISNVVSVDEGDEEQKPKGKDEIGI